MKNKTVMLTGGTGFLGSYLLKQLLAQKFNVILLKRSFSNVSRIKRVINETTVCDIDITDLDEIFRENQIDVIIHCATNYGRKDKDRFKIVSDNFLFPLRLLELSIKYNNAATFINTDTIFDRSVNDYALAKKQFKDWLERSSEYKKCINISLEQFYGPYDDTTKFVTFLIDKLLSKVKYIDFTKGEQKRAFVYIDDVVNAFMTILNHSNSLENGFYEFEVGGCKKEKIRNIIELTKKITGNQSTELRFGKVPYRINDLKDIVVNTSSLETLGWKQKVSLEEGIKMTVEKERQNRGN